MELMFFVILSIVYFYNVYKLYNTNNNSFHGLNGFGISIAFYIIQALGFIGNFMYGDIDLSFHLGISDIIFCIGFNLFAIIAIFLVRLERKSIE